MDLDGIFEYGLKNNWGKFSYPVDTGKPEDNCLGHLSNDLGWSEWEKKQCTARFPRHNIYNKLCCKMFNYQESGKENFQKETGGKVKKFWEHEYFSKVTMKPEPICYYKQMQQNLDYEWDTRPIKNNPGYEPANQQCLDAAYATTQKHGKTNDGLDWVYSKAQRPGSVMCGAIVEYTNTTQDSLNANQRDLYGVNGLDIIWCQKASKRPPGYVFLPSKSIKIGRAQMVEKEAGDYVDRLYSTPSVQYATVRCPEDMYVLDIDTKSVKGGSVNGLRLFCGKLDGSSVYDATH